MFVILTYNIKEFRQTNGELNKKKDSKKELLSMRHRKS